MHDKAVFFVKKACIGQDEFYSALPSGEFNDAEWKAFRLLTLAGYTIVLVAPDRSGGHAECCDGRKMCAPVLRRDHHAHLSKQVMPVLHATAALRIDLTHSWVVGDRLDTVEVGRVIGCKTVFLTNGTETGWDMTAMRWPDFIAGDIWEIACLIVMSDNESVIRLSEEEPDMEE
jgi:hypothetical protein